MKLDKARTREEREKARGQLIVAHNRYVECGRAIERRQRSGR